MTREEIDTLDTLNDEDYVFGQLSDDGKYGQSGVTYDLRILELEIPPSMVPPSTDDTDSKMSEQILEC